MLRLGQARPSSDMISYGLALSALAAVALLSFLGRLPTFVALGYWALSMVSVFAYAFDKSASRRGGQRLSENSLHLISLLGGWPGALIAQQWFRHKTKKRSFRTAFWLTVATNSAGVAWLLSPAPNSLPAP